MRFTALLLAAPLQIAAAVAQDVRPDDLFAADWRERNAAALALRDAAEVDVAGLVTVLVDAEGRGVAVEHGGDWRGLGGSWANPEDPVEKWIMRPHRVIPLTRLATFRRRYRAIERRGDLCVPWGSSELAAWVLGAHRVVEPAALDALGRTVETLDNGVLRVQAAAALVAAGEPARARIERALADVGQSAAMTSAFEIAGDRGTATLLEILPGLFERLGDATVGAIACRYAVEALSADMLRAHGDVVAPLVDQYLDAQLAVAWVIGGGLLSTGRATVPFLRAALDEAGSGRCLRAVGLIALIGADAAEATPELVALVEDAPGQIAAWAAQALARIRPRGEAATRAVAALGARYQTSRVPMVRLSILEALGGLGPALDDRAREVLTGALDDEFMATRLAAVRALRVAGRRGWSTFERLCAMAADEDEDELVRAEAFDALIRMGRRGLPHLERGILAEAKASTAKARAKELDDEQLDESFQEFEALFGRVRTPEPRRFDRVFDDQDPEVKRHLLLWLEHEAPEVRRLALVGIGALEPFTEEFVAVLEEATRDDEPAVRAAALRALRAHADPATGGFRTHALTGLHDPAPQVRLAAVEAVAGTRDVVLVESLLVLARGGRTVHRAAALDALGKTETDSEPILTVARNALTDPSVVVQRSAITLLERRGRPTAETVEALQRLIGGRRHDDAVRALLAIVRRDG